MEAFLKALSIIFLSAIKHTFGGVPLAAVLNMNYFEIVLYTFIGGMIGVVFFMFAYQSVLGVFYRFFPPRKKRRMFSFKNRNIVKIKRVFGLPGIAFFTPFLFSIPVGTIIACMYFKNKKRVFISIGLSVMGWSLVGGALANEIAQWLG